jgi:hypothetical protein
VKRILEARHVVLILALSVSSAVNAARHLPNADLVAQRFKEGQFLNVLKGCKSAPMSAPPNSGEQLECWAARTASDLSKQPAAVRSLVLDAVALDAALTRCKILTYGQRQNSEECIAAGHADSFIALRQPRMSLEPLKFNH